MNHVLKIQDEEIEIPFDEDGYIFATLISKRVNKDLSNYFRMNETKHIIELICQEFSITKEKIVIIKRGNSKKFNKQGTWIHRELVLHFAIWCSPYFTLQVNQWMEEWIDYKKENEIKFYHELYNMKEYLLVSESKEKVIQLRLQKELGGQIEIKTENGFIDLLTDTEIIEIKIGCNWKHAVGQILMYSLDYPQHKKRIHLFDMEYDEKINRSCSIYNINVSFE
jgi:hypothetical protein